MSNYVISAKCHSDDHVVAASFDALPWFKEATADEIMNLAKCGWRGDYPADAVAEYMADQDGDVADVFKYLELVNRDRHHNCMGFECSVNGDEALNWLKKNRTEIAAEIELDHL